MLATDAILSLASKIPHQFVFVRKNTIVDLPNTPLVAELGEYWLKNNIGEIGWEDEKEDLFVVNFCSDCFSRSYGAGYTLCPFKEGLFEAVFDSKLGKKFRVTEVECCGTQTSGCLFKVDYSPE